MNEKVKKLFKLYRKLISKRFNNKNVMKNALITNADAFIRHYENLYREYWMTRDEINEENTIGALYEAEFIGRKFFGLTEEVFNLIQYKIQWNN